MSSGVEATKFDPYFKWLGIPKREQPPSHYRLLGIAPEESDAAAIAQAGERQTRVVRESAQVKHADLAERLAGEIAAAVACLTDPAARAAYDEELKKSQPKAVRAPRQSRFDALQVSFIDESLSVRPDEPVVAVPPAAPAARVEPKGLELADETPSKLALGAAEPVRASADPVKPAPEPAKPVVEMLDLAGDSAVAAVANNGPGRGKSREALAGEGPDLALVELPADPTPGSLPTMPTRAPMPPTERPANSGGGFKTTTLVAVIAGACLLAGGGTLAFLMMGSGSSKDAEAVSARAHAAASAVPAATTAPVDNSAPSKPETAPGNKSPAEGAAKAAAAASQPSPGNGVGADLNKAASALLSAMSKPAATPEPHAATPAEPSKPFGEAETPATNPAANAVVAPGSRWTLYMLGAAGAKPRGVVFAEDHKLHAIDGEDIGQWSEADGKVSVRMSEGVGVLNLSSDRKNLAGRLASGVSVRFSAGISKVLEAAAKLPPKPTRPDASPMAGMPPMPGMPTGPGMPQMPGMPPGAPGFGQPEGAPENVAGPAAVAAAGEWVLPLRNIRAFRSAWVKGDESNTLQYTEESRTVLIDSPGNLGGFQYRKPWRQVQMTLHADVFVGRLEIQVNDTTLKFGTATALIRKTATILLDYDPKAFKLTATIGGRQVASATVLGDDFQSTLKCELRSEGGRAKVQLQDVKILPQ